MHRLPGLTAEGRDQPCGMCVRWRWSGGVLETLSVEGNPGEPPGGGSPQQTRLQFLTQNDLSPTGRLFLFLRSMWGETIGCYTPQMCVHTCTHTDKTPKRIAPQVLATTTCPSQMMAL